MLTGKQELFCHEYLKDLNATQAALRAGYAPSTAKAAWQDVLGVPEVSERIAELHAGRAKRLQIDGDNVLREILDIALADPAAAYDEDGSFKRDVHQIPINLRRTIASIKTTQGGILTEVKFWPKDRALDMLMRHLSLYNDKLAVEGVDDLAERILRARGRAPS